MPELPIVRAKDVVKALQKAGFVEVRTRGSHVQSGTHPGKCELSHHENCLISIDRFRWGLKSKHA